MLCNNLLLSPSALLLAVLPLRRRFVAHKGILRLGEIALHAVHLDAEVALPQVRLDPRRQRGNLILLRLDERRMVGLAVLFVSFLGVDKISGHVILELLQKAKDLAALRCVTAQIAEQPHSEPQDGWVGAGLKFHHLDNSVHSRLFEFQSP